MVPNHESYPSIESHDNSKFISKIQQERKTAGDWVVTEKIHGANFCMIISNEPEISCARRKALLTENEFFYNWKEIRKVGG